jgi:ketosteroid isomerase-like protein
VSQLNIEKVRAAYQALNRGDMAAAFAVLDPTIEIVDHDIPDAGEYRGVDGLMAWQADWERSWESWRWRPQSFIDAGDRVVTVFQVHARGRSSGVEVERVEAAVWTMQDGRVVRLDYYGSKDDALAAVGLSE